MNIDNRQDVPTHKEKAKNNGKNCFRLIIIDIMNHLFENNDDNHNNTADLIKQEKQIAMIKNERKQQKQ